MRYPLLGAMLSLTLLLAGSKQGVAQTSRVVEVPAGPAFVQLPGRAEISARRGQSLTIDTQLRTRKPGRMQVLLANGSQFRMGGDAQLRLTGSSLELVKGSVIGWVRPDAKRRGPFSIRTRLATASIQGTTVFIELNDAHLKIFSWEGTVLVRLRDGREVLLQGGEQLLLEFKPLAVADASAFGPPQRMGVVEIKRRLRTSPLINGFSEPLDTLGEIERDLGVSVR